MLKSQTQKMPKLKQTTLFSMKSWENQLDADINKKKVILEKQETDVGLIIQTLLDLKKNSPSRTKVVSTGLDSTLFKLKKHSHKGVVSFVENLLQHWNLKQNENCTYLDSESKVQEAESFANVDDKKIIKIDSELKSQGCKKSESGANCDNKETIKHTKNFPITAKVPSSYQLKQITVKSTQCNEDFLHFRNMHFKYLRLVKDLHKAVEFFAQEIGEQEVKVYLNCSFQVLK